MKKVGPGGLAAPTSPPDGGSMEWAWEEEELPPSSRIYAGMNSAEQGEVNGLARSRLTASRLAGTSRTEPVQTTYKPSVVLSRIRPARAKLKINEHSRRAGIGEDQVNHHSMQHWFQRGIGLGNWRGVHDDLSANPMHDRAPRRCRRKPATRSAGPRSRSVRCTHP
jgi:hypothetical protein